MVTICTAICNTKSRCFSYRELIFFVKFLFKKNHNNFHIICEITHFSLYILMVIISTAIFNTIESCYFCDILIYKKGIFLSYYLEITHCFTLYILVVTTRTANFNTQIPVVFPIESCYFL